MNENTQAPIPPTPEELEAELRERFDRKDLIHEADVDGEGGGCGDPEIPFIEEKVPEEPEAPEEPAPLSSAELRRQAYGNKRGQ